MEKDINKIASFSVDHDKIDKGIYISRIDGDITTFDLRTHRPNGGEYLSDIAMHSVEHMLATYLRNGPIGGKVIYFGPMGCRTGFYLLTRDEEPKTVLAALIDALEKTISHEGEIFGNTREECGNYLCLSLDEAKEECKKYLAVLKSKSNIDFKYY